MNNGSCLEMMVSVCSQAEEAFLDVEYLRLLFAWSKTPDSDRVGKRDANYALADRCEELGFLELSCSYRACGDDWDEEPLT